MNLLQINKGSKQLGAKILFETVSLAVNKGEHIGVIGPNGAGKTTLFKILVGQDELDSGEYIKLTGLRIGYLEQESEWNNDILVEDFLQDNNTKPYWEIKKIGLELGLTDTHFGSPMKILSGGFRMRVKLLKLVSKDPQLLLLDEPTNFLDLESVLTLERFLLNYEAAFLLISHDREFLRRVTESTVEIEAGEITKFPGNIDDYFEQKLELQSVLQAQIANLEAKRKKVQDFVDRFRAKATKAKQAQSRIKQLEKMEVIEQKALPVRSHFQLPSPIMTGKEVFLIHGASIGYPGREILTNVHLRLERGQHLGIVGFNGAGKSTFLKTLAGKLPLLSGNLKRGYQVTVGYFAQHVSEELEFNSTILDCLQAKAHPTVNQQEILNLAGAMLFSGDDLYKKIKVLSGGEKSRVAMGQILLQKCPVLLMDEPTNHLDFDTVEALTEALRNYEGSIVVVSHDRGFVRRIATQILEVRSGRVQVYPGNYDEYVWSLEKGVMGDLNSSKVSNQTEALDSGKFKKENRKIEIENANGTKKFNYKEASKALSSEIKEVQKTISGYEKQIAQQVQLRDHLSLELLAAQGLKAEERAKELATCSKAIENLEDAMLGEMEKLEYLEIKLIELRATFN